MPPPLKSAALFRVVDYGIGKVDTHRAQMFRITTKARDFLFITNSLSSSTTKYIFNEGL